MRNLKHSYNKGFTFLELLIAVLILGILLAVSVPSYQAYVIKGNRVDMQSAMTEIAQKMATYQAANRSYEGASLSNPQIYGNTKFPKDKPLYDLSLSVTDSNNDGRADTWTLDASPIGGKRQKDDGQIRLNDQGWRCWTKGASSCGLTASSSWKDN